MENFKKKILETYAHFVQDRGKTPSVEELVKETNCSEGEFYQEFNTLTDVRNALWQHFAESTVMRIQKEEVYPSYSAREKALSFCYTLIEELKPFRAYVKYAYKHHVSFLGEPMFLKKFEASYKAFGLEVLAEGMDTGEIASRPFLSDHYHHIMWGLITFTIQFWLKDKSDEFEQTDTAIEKSVNLAFDFMAHGVFDSAFDFGKFMFQFATKK